MLGFFSLFSKEPERISPSIIEASDDFQKKSQNHKKSSRTHSWNVHLPRKSFFFYWMCKSKASYDTIHTFCGYQQPRAYYRVKPIL